MFVIKFVWLCDVFYYQMLSLYFLFLLFLSKSHLLSFCSFHHVGILRFFVPLMFEVVAVHLRFFCLRSGYLLVLFEIAVCFVAFILFFGKIRRQLSCTVISRLLCSVFQLKFLLCCSEFVACFQIEELGLFLFFFPPLRVQITYRQSFLQCAIKMSAFSICFAVPIST